MKIPFISSDAGFHVATVVLHSGIHLPGVPLEREWEIWGTLYIRTYLPIWILEMTSWENSSYKELEDGIVPVCLLSGFFLLKVWWKSIICDHFCLQVLKCHADMLCWGLYSPVALSGSFLSGSFLSEVFSSRKVSWIFSLTTCLLFHYFLSRAFYFWWWGGDLLIFHLYFLSSFYFLKISPNFLGVFISISMLSFYFLRAIFFF